MNYPPYHLRPNKAIDRLALVEAIRRLGRVEQLSEYTYCGFGGPYLEDFRILYELCRDVTDMISIEKDPETHKQQKFHKPFRALTLKNEKFSSFLASYEPADRKSIFWLDYTRLTPQYLNEFSALLVKLPEGSMIKITLKSEPKDYGGDKPSFGQTFASYVDDPESEPPGRLVEFSTSIQEMIRIISQRALPDTSPLVFQIVSSFCYKDHSGMYTLTGIVSSKDKLANYCQQFQGWELSNLDWSPPELIDFPILSTKERLLLQSHLPCDRGDEKRLLKELGYRFTENEASTLLQLRQYSRFNRYSPFFMKVSP